MLLLDTARIRYEFVDALTGDTQKLELKNFKPANSIPTFEHQEHLIREQSTIMTYIAETNQETLSKWFPSHDPMAKAKINFWLHWNASNVRPAAKTLLQSKLFPVLKTSPIVLDSGKKTLDRSLTLLESHFSSPSSLSSTPSSSITTPPLFLSGSSHPSIADLCLLTELDQLSPQAFSLLDLQASHPSVHQWMTRLTQGGEGGEEVGLEGRYLPTYGQSFQILERTAKNMI